MIMSKNENEDIHYISEKIKHLPKETVIGEFSGRDSVAAILKSLEQSDVKFILPVATLSPTEYGDFDSLEINFDQMVKRVNEIYGDKKKIFPLMWYSNPDLWSIMNGRFVEHINRKFGFYSPCIGCHAYFHILRVPMALDLGKRIISGERESHDGRVKINQMAITLDVYKDITDHFGVELMTPLRHMSDGDEVEKLIGWNWKEGKNHPSCAYSKNYTDTKGKVIYDIEKIESYLKDYLYETCIKLGKVLIKDQNADKSTMLEVLKEID